VNQTKREKVRKETTLAKRRQLNCHERIILAKPEILNQIRNGRIRIEPYDENAIGPAPVDINDGYLLPKDSNRFFIGTASRQGYATDAYLGERIVSLSSEKGRLFFVLAYNQVDSSLPEVKHQRATLNMNYLLRRNLKWVNEYTHDLDGDKHKFLTGLVVGS